MEIEVNDYVRTKNGKIRKKTEEYQFNKYGKFWFLIKENNKIENCNEYFIDTINEKDIIKHSKNIIDLIEIGDYVNGMKVLSISVPNDVWEPIEIYVDSKTVNYLIQDEIKSITTKEQFSSLEYII